MCSRLFGTIQWEGNHRAPVLRHVQHRGIRSAAHHKCPVNQNLVTIKANPQLGVRGTLAPPRDIRPRGAAWADLLEPQQFARWLVSDQRLGWVLAVQKAWQGRKRKHKGHFNSGMIRRPSQSNPSVAIATISGLRDALVTAMSRIC